MNDWKFNLEQFNKPNPMCNDDMTPYTEYKKCNLPLEEKMIRLGNPNAKFKLVFLQGGPDYNFGNEELKELFTNKEHFYGNSFYWLLHQNVELIIVREAQHTKVSQFKDTKGFTRQAGELETKETLDTLFEILNYFKKENKYTVGLYTISYAAFLMMEFIHKYDYKVADKIIVGHGKVNIKEFDFMEDLDAAPYDDRETVRGNLEWMKSEFEKEGKDPEYIKKELDRTKTYQSNLVYPLNHNYVEKNAGKDVSNCVFVGSDDDTVVGPLTSEEQNWITSNNGELKYYLKGNINKVLAEYKEKTGRDWTHHTYQQDTDNTDPGFAAHFFTFITKEALLENVLEPMGWNSLEHEDKSVDFYNCLKKANLS